jgi:tagatose 1,6-diphosphate aldolase
MTPLGVARGLAQCASDEGVFTILALDHRQNLRRDLRPDDPGSVGDAELVDFKRTVVRALASRATGILLDPLYGAAQAVADAALPGAVGLIVALEETGFVGDATDRRTVLIDGWDAAAARRLGAAAAKLLVYFNPDARSAQAQEDLVAATAESCRAQQLPLFLEPLTFSLGDNERLAGEARRRVVVETARRLGRYVDVLKVEFPYDSSVTDTNRWRDACQELDAAAGVPWVLLSGGVANASFMAQVEVACRSGASGVAAGRAIWAEATGLSGAAREAFLRGTAARRLTELRDLVDATARPWTDIVALEQHPESISPDWFRR